MAIETGLPMDEATNFLLEEVAFISDICSITIFVSSSLSTKGRENIASFVLYL